MKIYSFLYNHIKYDNIGIRMKEWKRIVVIFNRIKKSFTR